MSPKGWTRNCVSCGHAALVAKGLADRQHPMCLRVEHLRTILGPTREAGTTGSGLRNHESVANQGDLTPRSDPRMDAHGRADVRTTFACTPSTKKAHCLWREEEWPLAAPTSDLKGSVSGQAVVPQSLHAPWRTTS
jgi:hypothetical protein